MGQCGCGDFYGDFKFKGPDGVVYVVDVYCPCDYCHTPAGVVIYAMDNEDQQLWDVENIPEIKIADVGTFIGVLHPEVFAEKIKSLAGLDIEGAETDFNRAAAESVQDEINKNRKRLVQ